MVLLSLVIHLPWFFSRKAICWRVLMSEVFMSYGRWVTCPKLAACYCFVFPNVQQRWQVKLCKSPSPVTLPKGWDTVHELLRVCRAPEILFSLMTEPWLNQTQLRPYDWLLTRLEVSFIRGLSQQMLTVFPQGLWWSHGRDNRDTELKWMACSHCSLSRFAIQFNKRWSRLLRCLWKGQRVQKQQEGNGGRLQAGEEKTLFFFIPEWTLYFWGRRRNISLTELPTRPEE